MRVKRKIIANQFEIDNIRQQNQLLISDYAGQRNVPQLPVPEPIYKVYEWNFRVNQLNSFYVERTIIRPDGSEAKAPRGEGDIIAGVLYEGIIRLEYDPIVVNKFNLVLNGE